MNTDKARTNSFRTPVLIAVLCALGAISAAGQGYHHGTAEAVITSADNIVAAIDSKEVGQAYLSDGTSVTEDRISCKVRRIGPYYVLIAGITRAADGFDASREAVRLYRDGDSLDVFAARLSDELPNRLTPILDALRAANGAAFDGSFRNQDVLELTLLGVEGNQPRVVIVAFHASQSGAGRVAIDSRLMSCPGNCRDPNSVYLAGMHNEAEGYLYNNPEIAGDTSTNSALQLIGLEYTSHPEVVGGPASVVRVTRGGAVLEQAGACADDAGLPRLEAQLDRAIAAVADVVVDEDVEQYSKRGRRLHSNAIHGDVRVIGGNEEYTWAGRDAGGGHLPEPWCGGELATMMRVTSLELGRAQGALSMETSAATEPALVVAFHATAAERYWQLVVASRTYPLAFDGRAWFSQATGKLLRIHWEATDLLLPASAGITRIEWDETFSNSDIAGHSVLTPNTAVYRVHYSWKADRSDWTETRFSGFRRFGATEILQFGQVGFPDTPPES